MNNPTEINWLILLVPSVVTGVFLIFSQVIFALWLSKRIEGHKLRLNLDLASYQSSLNQKLEDHKASLNGDLQAHLASLQAANQVAQTKFSAFHTRRAEAIERLYELVSTVETRIQEWLVFDSLSKPHSKQDHFKMLRDYEEALTSFFDHKRIYWDKELMDSFFEFYETARWLIPTEAAVNIGVKNVDSPHNTRAVARLNSLGRKFGDDCVRLLNA